METNDRQQFAEALVATGEVYGRKVSSSLAEIYFADLSGYSIDQVLGALTAHRKDATRGQYFPKPADLIHQLERITGHDAEADAALAWETTLKLGSNYRRAEHADPLAEQAVRLIGGWERIGMSTDRDRPFLRKEFIEKYVNQSEREVTQVNALALESSATRLGTDPAEQARKLAGALGVNRK